MWVCGARCVFELKFQTISKAASGSLWINCKMTHSVFAEHQVKVPYSFTIARALRTKSF